MANPNGVFGRVHALETELSSLTAKVTQLSAQVTTFSAQVSGFQNRMDALATLQGEFLGFRDRVATRLDGFNQELRDLKSDVVKLTQDVTEVLALDDAVNHPAKKPQLPPQAHAKARDGAARDGEVLVLSAPGKREEYEDRGYDLVGTHSDDSEKIFLKFRLRQTCQ
jgi:outer membrane murein-binding lipoprotein Lpp